MFFFILLNIKYSSFDPISKKRKNDFLSNNSLRIHGYTKLYLHRSMKNLITHKLY
jgi:hypothetical protein